MWRNPRDRGQSRHKCLRVPIRKTGFAELPAVQRRHVAWVAGARRAGGSQERRVAPSARASKASRTIESVSVPGARMAW